MRRHKLFKIAIVGTIATMAFAMAATLGVTGGDMGAGNGTVAACDPNGVTTSMVPSWDATDDQYEVGTITVSGIAAACDTQTMKVTVTDGTNSLGEATTTLDVDPATSDDVTLATPVAAAAITGVHVTIAAP